MVKSSYMSKGKTLGQIFKDARLKKGLTQVELAQKAGLHWNTIAKIEREEQLPGFPTSQSLGEVLDVPIKVIVPFYRKS
jgi:DNA-binding XRE family transcriptional regulator